MKAVHGGIAKEEVLTENNSISEDILKQKSKKIICEKCNKSVLANNLKSHLETCKGKKRIICVKCNKSVLENNYKNHMERAHVNMIGKYDTSGVCHHCGEVRFFKNSGTSLEWVQRVQLHLSILADGCMHPSIFRHFAT